MKRLLLIMLCAAAGLKGFAQTQPVPQTYSFTVQDAVNYAYEHQDSVKNSRLDVQNAENTIKQIVATGLPQISGQVTFQDYLKIPTILFPDGKGGYQSVSIYQKYSNNAGLSLSQLLFDGSFFIGLKARSTYRELSNKSLTRSKIATNTNVTKAYYQVLVSDEQVKLLDANINQLKQQLDQTVAQNKQGFVEKIDVDRITVQYNNLTTTRENTLRLLGLNYALLKFQMGMPIEYNLTLKDKLADITLDSNAANLNGDSTAYKNRIEYSLSETAMKINQFDVRRKKAAFLPTLSFNANSSILYQNNEFSKLYNQSFPSTYIGLTLNIPIFSGGMKTAILRQSQIVVQKNQNDLNNLKNALSLQVQQANIVYFNGLQSLGNQKRNQELAREVLRVSKIKYQQGVGSSIEVTQAQTALETADNQYIQALYDALVSKVDLDKAYGRIQ
ncbi:TolC family protein [Mucilaginibacter psychrotolerans]|uniref:TolC family protein n=1 Tax=Mucilaginibacter psychrotolerans TaxID=1524096 RepID=A0A4Y8SC96_9SPHI|nr:TolC family protein [Mucilaginibacter psychrotolerans]TFF36669.1 TolC family protein [Mucilaginibacter psychrotolerans]